MSAVQIFEAEEKLRLKSLLGLKSAKYGVIKFSPSVLKDLEEMQYCETARGKSVTLDKYMALIGAEFEITSDIESSILYIGGYAAFKIASRTKCMQCTLFASSDCTDDSFFNEINRGGLTVPSAFVVRIGRHAFKIAYGLFSELYETLFLCEVKDQFGIHMDLTQVAISLDEELCEVVEGKCACGKHMSDLCKYVTSVFCNCLSNNYRKNRNDNLKNDDRMVKESKKPKKRKLATLTNKVGMSTSSCK